MPAPPPFPDPSPSYPLLASNHPACLLAITWPFSSHLHLPLRFSHLPRQAILYRLHSLWPLFRIVLFPGYRNSLHCHIAQAHFPSLLNPFHAHQSLRVYRVYTWPALFSKKLILHRGNTAKDAKALLRFFTAIQSVYTMYSWRPLFQQFTSSSHQQRSTSLLQPLACFPACIVMYSMYSWTPLFQHGKILLSLVKCNRYKKTWHSSLEGKRQAACLNHNHRASPIYVFPPPLSIPPQSVGPNGVPPP